MGAVGPAWQAGSVCAPSIAQGLGSGIAAGVSVFEMPVSTHLLSRGLHPPPSNDERGGNFQAMDYCRFEPPSLSQWALAELASSFTLALHHQCRCGRTALPH